MAETVQNSNMGDPYWRQEIKMVDNLIASQEGQNKKEAQAKACLDCLIRIFPHGFSWK
jgi:hypothetical protein